MVFVIDNDEAEDSTVLIPVDDVNKEIELENLQRIEKMSKQDIEKAKQEIVERFGEFLQIQKKFSWLVHSKK